MTAPADVTSTAGATNPAADADGSRLSSGERLAAVLFGLWLLIGLFLDGWAHDNSRPESFFTPWHGVLYSGFTAAGLAALEVVRRRRTDGAPWLSAVPRGHGLTLAGLAVFSMGAVLDLLWHEFLGIEVGIEALLSPTHLLLLVSGVVALSAPLRDAWVNSATEQPALRPFVPTLLSLALLTAVVGFFLAYLSPFLNDAAGAGFDRRPGDPHDHPASDPAELAQLLGVASILTTTVLLTAPVLLVLRRWRPPPHALAFLVGVVVTFLVGADEFAMPELVAAGVAAGAAGDLARRRLPLWAVPAVVTAVLWLAYFGLYAVREGAVEWSAELWSGTVVLSTGIAAGLGIVAGAPGGGAAQEQRPRAVAGTR